jgi:hypothetical protein
MDGTTDKGAAGPFVARLINSPSLTPELNGSKSSSQTTLIKDIKSYRELALHPLTPVMK